MPFLLLVTFFVSLAAAEPRVALVYSGPGACTGADGDCAGAAAMVAELAGMQVRFVGPDALAAGAGPGEYEQVFGGVSVWIQPGGQSGTFQMAATAELKEGIRRFIREGGG